ncbi:hypothetical protein MSAN_00222500 [Mycena sanguinolenta]|uniref:Uncharacterized protein n=1 Tax=Mycena sanguinolenta TaxID=230812 RepID=A0A8H6ZJC4_9AGAR|nr:hypothetical protein MSAN_00222500 [Mycena sanguinolenta]
MTPPASPSDLSLTASAPSLSHLRLIYCYSARLDLRGLAQLRTLSFDIAEPIKECMQLFARTLVFPPQTFALVLNVCTSSIHHEIAQLVHADRTLADLPCITSVTAVFLSLERIGKDPQALELVDVSDKLAHKMLLLVSRLQGTGTLRILRSLRLPDHPW